MKVNELAEKAISQFKQHVMSYISGAGYIDLERFALDTHSIKEGWTEQPNEKAKLILLGMQIHSKNASGIRVKYKMPNGEFVGFISGCPKFYPKGGTKLEIGLRAIEYQFVEKGVCERQYGNKMFGVKDVLKADWVDYKKLEDNDPDYYNALLNI